MKKTPPDVVRTYLIVSSLGTIGLSMWLIVSGANPFIGIFGLICGGLLLFAFVRMDGSSHNSQRDGHMPSTPWRRRLLLIAIAAVLVAATFLRRGPNTLEALIAIGIGITLVEVVLFWQRRSSQSSDND